MPQFDTSTILSQIFWLSLVFVILHLIVSKFIAPKIEGLSKLRDNIFENDIALAKELSEKAANIEVQNSSELNNLYSEIAENDNKQIVELDRKFKNELSEIDKFILTQQNNNIKKIEKLEAEFSYDEENACIELASRIISKLTEKKADSKILAKIYKNL